jgi:NDP-4-keto-2,6-dideoxyhexose 3-C-methyltransferase
MFYDLHNPVDFAQGVRHVLNRNGIWVIEVSYLPLVLQRNAFDSICHEHLEYYRLQDILNIASQADLRIVDFSTNDSNGGSLRVFLSRNDSDYGANDLKLSQFLHEEPSGKLLRNQLKIMRSNIEKSGAEIREIISHWKEDSERVFALGASTKGNILLNYFGLDKLGIEGVIDRNPSKVGKFTPVGCLPIFAEDYTLSLAKWKAIVLPWHFKKSILNREIGRKVRNQEVALLFPLPELEMVNIN